jgi:transposase-like protein
LLRELAERARKDGLRLTGEGGLLGLTKIVVEDALEGEMDDHLGYSKRRAGRSFSDRRTAPVRHVRRRMR